MSNQEIVVMVAEGLLYVPVALCFAYYRVMRRR